MKNRMKIYYQGKLIETIDRPKVAGPGRLMRRQMDFAKRNALGSNQFRTRRKSDYKKFLFGYLAVIIVIVASVQGLRAYMTPDILSPLPEEDRIVRVARAAEIVEAPKVTVVPIKKAVATPTPEASELSEIVGYIAQKFEPEGKAVVVRAINCFYSESGLRENAVGQNSDGPKSKDYGVAQLNDYWHKLTTAQKTEYKANIDKAYDIYKGRSRNGGNGFSAWYGKACN